LTWHYFLLKVDILSDIVLTKWYWVTLIEKYLAYDLNLCGLNNQCMLEDFWKLKKKINKKPISHKVYFLRDLDLSKVTLRYYTHEIGKISTIKLFLNAFNRKAKILMHIKNEKLIYVSAQNFEIESPKCYYF
jgi:hypothetical protein